MNISDDEPGLSILQIAPMFTFGLKLRKYSLTSARHNPINLVKRRRWRQRSTPACRYYLSMLNGMRPGGSIARWSGDIKKATHGLDDHPLKIGNIEIPCYIVDGKQRLLSLRRNWL